MGGTTAVLRIGDRTQAWSSVFYALTDVLPAQAFYSATALQEAILTAIGESTGVPLETVNGWIEQMGGTPQPDAEAATGELTANVGNAISMTISLREALSGSADPDVALLPALNATQGLVANCSIAATGIATELGSLQDPALLVKLEGAALAAGEERADLAALCTLWSEATVTFGALATPSDITTAVSELETGVVS